VIVMGVAGSGKTTIGSLLASELGCPFWDADSFHSEASIAKMQQRTPLTDADREPWLRMLRDQVVNAVAGHTLGVLACSSLKASHRHILTSGKDRVCFAYLRVTPELARTRLLKRPSHFMSAELVDSQFAELEEPDDAIIADGALPPPRVIETILRGLNAAAIAAATEGMPPEAAVSLDAPTLASLRSVWSEAVPTETFNADRAIALVVNRFCRYEVALRRIVDEADNQQALLQTAQIAAGALTPPRWLVPKATRATVR
jgi:gluconokinase